MTLLDQCAHGFPFLYAAASSLLIGSALGQHMRDPCEHCAVFRFMNVYTQPQPQGTIFFKTHPPTQGDTAAAMHVDVQSGRASCVPYVAAWLATGKPGAEVRRAKAPQFRVLRRLRSPVAPSRRDYTLPD